MADNNTDVTTAKYQFNFDYSIWLTQTIVFQVSGQNGNAAGSGTGSWNSIYAAANTAATSV